MTDSDLYPISRVKPEDTTTELKCVVVTPILRYLQSEFGEGRMRRVVADTEMNIDYLLNADNWVSYNYFLRLLRRLVEVTGNPRAPFVAARVHSDMSTYGLVARFLKHLGSPKQSYQLIVQFHSLWNRISRWRLAEARGNHCVISVQLLSRHQQDKNNCLSIQGSLATIPRQYGLPHARVTEQRCACDGADACVYEIRWVNKPARLRGYIGALAGLAMGGVCIWFEGWAPSVIGCGALLALAGYFAGRKLDYGIRLGEVYAQNEEQASSLLESIRAIEKLNEELQQKVEQRTAELSDANGRLAQALKDLQDSQERTILAERQAAVGVLAAGMAHEMNNPMNAIRLSLQALSEGLADSNELAPVVETASRATCRCSRIVSDLLSFSRDPQKIVPVALRDIAQEAVAEFLREHPEGFRIAVEVRGDAIPLRLDRAQIKQVLANILSNAFDAMEGKGDVEVQLDRGDREVVLSVTDHGPGIEESLRRRVFDPFFTTKKSALRKGTGLGLSIAYQLMQRNGGTIEVLSEIGQGATFVLRFPLTVGPEGGGTASAGAHE